MSYISLKEAVERILNKSSTAEQVVSSMDPKELPYLEHALEKTKNKLSKPGSYDPSGDYDPSSAPSTTDMSKFGGHMSGEMPPGGEYMIRSEVVKYDSNGQWSFEKQDGERKIDYSEFNKPTPPDESKARTLDYGSMKSPSQKKPWTGAKQRSAEAAERAKTSKFGKV